MKQKKEKQSLVEAVEMVLPPEMPIIIDEQAVEDILGVKYLHCILCNLHFQIFPLASPQIITLVVL